MACARYAEEHSIGVLLYSPMGVDKAVAPTVRDSFLVVLGRGRNQIGSYWLTPVGPRPHSTHKCRAR